MEEYVGAQNASFAISNHFLLVGMFREIPFE
jgi:hypothetical protein